MSIIRKRFRNRPSDTEIQLRALNKQETATLAEIEKLEAASLRSLRTVTIKGKTKAPDDAQYLANYDEKIAAARATLADIRNRRDALLNPEQESDSA